MKFDELIKAEKDCATCKYETQEKDMQPCSFCGEQGWPYSCWTPKEEKTDE